MNIVGDLAGNYLTLMALIRKMPDEDLICVGDLNDRGPRTRQCIEWFMKNGNSTLGNHEHMMINTYRGGWYYDFEIWPYCNGGLNTLFSYLKEDSDVFQWVYELYKRSHTDEIDVEDATRLQSIARTFIPKEHIEWLETRPLFLEYSDGLFISHAPKCPIVKREQLSDLGEGFKNYDPRSDRTLLWNRGWPAPWENKFQVYGHNASKTPKFFSHHYKQGYSCWVKEDQCYAACLDTSREKVLTGMHWPSMEIFQQEYID